MCSGFASVRTSFVHSRYSFPLCRKSTVGKAQGFISGIYSFANVASPLPFSPLTALFPSERAPFNFPGFSIMCVGFASVRTSFVHSRYSFPLYKKSTVDMLWSNINSVLHSMLVKIGY
ncbi:hippocampus abundant transcript-like protein 1 isoform X3 [Gossypium australe]|uniref:Hippocampus abundant transcript-like protein 1 isoform X3 n=1 Tax=Gossypium australe TaxID=47621 RepID=A0A5B6W9Z5_9ROSI|nr:hippocampus abundant transcript-like protein 1 isoform X3 [Gossypium australe]